MESEDLELDFETDCKGSGDVALPFGTGGKEPEDHELEFEADGKASEDAGLDFETRGKSAEGVGFLFEEAGKGPRARLLRTRGGLKRSRGPSNSIPEARKSAPSPGAGGRRARERIEVRANSPPPTVSLFQRGRPRRPRPR